MRFVDAHLHTDMIEDIQLQKLVMMGMEAAVIPSPHMFLGSHDADAVLLLWERFLTLEANTAKTLGFEAYASLSVPFFGVTAKDAEKCLEKLPDFLKHDHRRHGGPLDLLGQEAAGGHAEVHGLFAGVIEDALLDREALLSDDLE